MRGRPAQQFDDTPVGQLAQQRRSAGRPPPTDLSQRGGCEPGLIPGRRYPFDHRAFRPDQPVGHPRAELAQAVRVVEHAGQDRRHAEGEDVAPTLFGQPPEEVDDGQVGPGPGLVKPLLAHRPGAGVGHPGQVRVQHDAAGAHRRGRTGHCEPSRAQAAPVRDDDQVETVVHAVGADVEIRGAHPLDGPAQPRVPPVWRAGELCRHDRPVPPLPAAQAPAVAQAEEPVGDEVLLDDLPQLGRRELAGVEGVQRRFPSGRERQSVGGREQQDSRGTQYARALGEKPLLILEVLDDLHAGHDLDRPVRKGEPVQVGANHVHRGIAARRVHRRLLVGVDRDHFVRGGCQQRTPVSLAAPGFQDDRPRDERSQTQVGGFVPAKPVVLFGYARKRPLAGEFKGGRGHDGGHATWACCRGPVAMGVTAR